MQKGIIGKKIGMTQIFDEAGKVIPVTVVEAGPCVFFDNGVNMLLDKKTGCFCSLFGMSKKYQINGRPQVAATFCMQ